MAKRKRTIKRKMAKRKSPRRKIQMKKKLAGFTKTKGKFALVFKKGKTLSMGKGRYKNKKGLTKAAKKYVK